METRTPPVKVDVPVEDVDSDIAQGEDYPGLRNVWFLKPPRPKVRNGFASLFSQMSGVRSSRVRSP